MTNEELKTLLNTFYVKLNTTKNACKAVESIKSCEMYKYLQNDELYKAYEFVEINAASIDNLFAKLSELMTAKAAVEAATKPRKPLDVLPSIKETYKIVNPNVCGKCKFVTCTTDTVNDAEFISNYICNYNNQATTAKTKGYTQDEIVKSYGVAESGSCGQFEYDTTRADDEDPVNLYDEE